MKTVLEAVLHHVGFQLILEYQRLEKNFIRKKHKNIDKRILLNSVVFKLNIIMILITFPF